MMAKVTVSIEVENEDGNYVKIQAGGEVTPDADTGYEEVGAAVKAVGALAAEYGYHADFGDLSQAVAVPLSAGT